MTNYTAITDSGRTIILHGRRELRATVAAAERGEAEGLIRVTQGIDRKEHAYLYDLGQCYGPCSLSGR